MTDPTPDLVRRFYAHMAAEYGATVKPKATAWEMRAAGKFLGAIGIVDAGAFATQFVTTIGSTVFVPYEPGDDASWTLWSQITTLTHECQHIKQRSLRGLDYEVSYLSSKAKRSHIEAEAYATNVELHFWRTGSIEPWVIDHLAGHMASYGVSAVDVSVLRKHLEMIAVGARRGVVVSHAARTAIAWLDANAPELRGRA